MRRFATRSLLAATAILLVTGTPATAQISDQARLVAALDSAARAHVEHPAVAGVSVAVVRGGDELLIRGYGHVDLEWDVRTPEDGAASYEIGSITKQFTAVAIMQLVEQGMLDLDADFTEYLPDFESRGHAVPLRRLLDHTSGIKGYTEMPVFGDLVYKKLPRDTLVALVEAEPFEFEPGTAQIYNNSAYFFLGLIIESVSGQSYEEYVQEHLFDASGMADSYYCSEQAVRSARAHGYEATPEGLRRKSYLDHTWPYAAGSLCSTVTDLVRWNRALHGGRLLSADAYEAFTTPRPLLDGTELDYAMGVGVGDRNGVRVVSHGGGINGFLSDGIHVPEQELTVVVLQNSTGPAGPGALSSAMVDLLLGPRPEPIAVPYDGDLTALAGSYSGPARGMHMHMQVTVEGDELVLTVNDQSQGIRPVHVGDGVWQAGVVRLKMMSGAGRYMLDRVPGS
jgi:CubicO group peptidase (beta-lactamase class C family)